ncbi:MAG: L-dopachrome tautomerase-related protein [Methylotetracoccus sp.]
MPKFKPIFHAAFVIGLAISAKASAEPSTYDIVARLNQGPGNVTVTETGRVIMSQHQFYEPAYSVVELKGTDSTVPFPNAALNDRTGQSGVKLDSVLGIRAAPNGIVWMLDNGMRSGVRPKLVGWDILSERLHRVIYLDPPVTSKDQFVNDFAVDLAHKRIFISDPAGGADAGIIVVDLETGSARRVLQGHQSVVPEHVDLLIDGKPLQVKDAQGNLVRPHIGVNPITEDLQNEWVYFGPMHGHSLYRMRATDLADDKLSPETLAQRVERYADKPISDGISIDRDGNIYLGELAENAIGFIGADRKYRRLSQCPNLSWVDSFSFGPDGKLYAVVNRLHQSAMLNGGDNASKPPYFLLKVNALAAGMAGR